MEYTQDINLTITTTPAPTLAITGVGGIKGDKGDKGDTGATGAAGNNAPSDHTLLSNIGTNTHAQIDTAITTLTSGLATKAASVHTHAIADVSTLQTALDGKQATLVSATNIKTINGTTLLGSGDITISSGGGGVTDHGALTGLADDDHTQYHNDTRGDARYYTKTQMDTSLGGKEPTITTLTVAKGGTGVTSMTANRFLTSNGTGASVLSSKTIPTGTVVGHDDTQTLTNKTISGASNTVTNIGLTSLSATGTKDSTTYLRGDNTWATVSGGGSSPTTTKGDLAGYSTTSVRVPVGINGQVLVADSTEATGLAYKYLGTSSMYNYVPNPSFEVDYTGWSNYGGAGTITRDSGFAQFGTYSSKQVSASSTDGGIISASTFTLGPGTYTFSVYAKLSSDVVNACMILRGSEGLKVQINQTYPGNTNWNRYTATFTLSGSGTYEILLGLGSYGASSPGTVYFDAVQVELGASATSYFDGSTTPSGGMTYSWTGATGSSQSIKATGTSLTTTDYLPEGTINQYYSNTRAIAAMSGATISPTNVFANFVGGNTMRIYDPNTPASATATGTQGEIRWDSGYLYVCVSSNTWKRVALATW